MFYNTSNFLAELQTTNGRANFPQHYPEQRFVKMIIWFYLECSHHMNAELTSTAVLWWHCQAIILIPIQLTAASSNTCTFCDRISLFRGWLSCCHVWIKDTALRLICCSSIAIHESYTHTHTLTHIVYGWTLVDPDASVLLSGATSVWCPEKQCY